MGLIGRAVLGFNEDGLARAGEVLWYRSGAFGVECCEECHCL